MGSIGGCSEGQLHNDSFAITTPATLRSRSPPLGRNVAVMALEPPVDSMDLNERPLSPSVDAEGPLQVEDGFVDAEQLGCPDLRSKRSIWQTSSLSRQVDRAKGTHRSLSVPSNAKARQQLRLPSFKSLGIVPLHSDALLTPPDEASLIHWTPSPLSISDPPTSQPPQELTGTVSQATMLEAPVSSGSVTEENKSPSSSAPAAPLIASHKDEKGDGGSTSSGDEKSEPPSWIECATQAIGTQRLQDQPVDGPLTHNSICCCCVERH